MEEKKKLDLFFSLCFYDYQSVAIDGGDRGEVTSHPSSLSDGGGASDGRTRWLLPPNDDAKDGG